MKVIFKNSKNMQASMQFYQAEDGSFHSQENCTLFWLHLETREASIITQHLSFRGRWMAVWEQPKGSQSLVLWEKIHSIQSNNLPPALIK
jgi:hypothetical protein